MTAPKPWTEAHRQEALRRTYELAAEIADVNDRRNGGPWIARHAFANVFDEQRWRGLLSSTFDAARIEREVRRVRGIAEGRLVREKGYRYEIRQGAYWLGSRAHREDAAAASKEAPGSHVVTVTIRRIRRRSP
ncbi:MAG TPA: hypothetical protein VLT47_11095 [Anaeromyxobacteraceae bacterium]|nr:hypothetical protein [Anaeromyxobacteraceae bacterium]